MRALFVGNRFPPDGTGGYELHCQATRDYFRAQGDEVRVLAGGDTGAGNAQARPAGSEVFRELRRSPWPARATAAQALGTERVNARTLSRHLREFRPDVVVWWRLGELSLSLVERVRWAGIPAVGVIGDGWLHEGPERDPWLAFAERRPAVAWLMAQLTGWPLQADFSDAAHWIFVSHDLQARAEAHGLHLARSSVVAPGLDPIFAGVANAGHAQPDWSWRVCFAGRLTASKGPDLAIRALALLPGQARLDIYGEGEARYEAGLRELVHELGLTRRVYFHGAVSRCTLAGAFTQSDVLLFPNRWTEPFGLVPLEAMAAGVPVVAVPTGGAAEYLRHEANALLVAEAEAGLLASAVCRLAREPALRASVTAGGEATSRRYSARDSGSEIHATVKEAVSVRRRPARWPARRFSRSGMSAAARIPRTPDAAHGRSCARGAAD